MSKGVTPKRLKGDNPPKDFHGNQEQFEKFLEAARVSGASDDPEVFNRLIAGIASQKTARPGKAKKNKTKKPAK